MEFQEDRVNNMREIKFRGKVKYNGNHYFAGDWVYGYFYSEDDEKFFILDSSEDEYGNIRAEWVEVDSETIGEYTGKKDRKRTEEFPEGQEIYEGDRWKRGSFIGIIEFKFSGWQLTKSEDSGCYEYPSFYGNATTGEIIGNIYETPSEEF